MGNNIVYKRESFSVIGACMEVHNELGPGFLEPVYQEALEIELSTQNIPFQREVRLPINYKRNLLNKAYVADFILFDKIILELKALDTLSSLHESQLLNYLKATGFKLGILVNFGQPTLQSKRLVF
jgi:GxxExxY protein